MFCLFLADTLNGSQMPGKNAIKWEENNGVELEHAVSHSKRKDFVFKGNIGSKQDISQKVMP